MDINVNLTPQLEKMVRQKVDSGLYASASEVVRAALRLMDEQDRLRAARLELLRQDIQAGLASGPGTGWDPEQVKREGRAKESDRVSRVAKVARRAVEVFGDYDQGRAWMTDSISALGGKTPLSLLDTVEGYELVVTTLSRIEYGVYA
jgi:antitoxin ParD1/3/4